MGKILLLLIVTVQGSITYAASSTSSAAYDLVSATKLLQPSIDAIESVMRASVGSPEELVEKDLSLCLLIGSSKEGSQGLALKALALKRESTNP